MASTIIRVKVKPRSRENSLAQTSDGTWLARVKAPPIEGRANRELIALVAQHFSCDKRAISIKSGESGRLKLVRIQTTNSRALARFHRSQNRDEHLIARISRG